MKNKKGNAGNIAELINLENELLMHNNTPNQNKFQYDCSFCLCELPTGGHRFDGIGACPKHYALAFKLVNGLRTHWRNYFSNLGVKR